MTPLDAFKVVVSQMLTGSKKAVRVNDTIYVSPAMYDLMKNADSEELKHLLANIPLLDMGSFNVFRTMESVITSAPAPTAPPPAP